MGRWMLAVLVTMAVASVADAQPSSPRIPLNAFGVARYYYVFHPEDGVFYWDDLRGTEAASLQYARAVSDQILSLYYTAAFTLATVNRAVYVAQPNLTFNQNSTIFGFEAGVGPRGRFGPLALFALGGFNALRVTEVQDEIGPGRSVTRWVGTGGISQYWAAQYNALNRQGPVQVFTFPAYARFSPAVTLGASLDVRRVRLSYEQLRVFARSTRTDNRVGLSVTY